MQIILNLRFSVNTNFQIIANIIFFCYDEVENTSKLTISLPKHITFH